MIQGLKEWKQTSYFNITSLFFEMVNAVQNIYINIYAI